MEESRIAKLIDHLLKQQSWQEPDWDYIVYELETLANDDDRFTKLLNHCRNSQSEPDWEYIWAEAENLLSPAS